jgi:hypothetical protein
MRRWSSAYSNFRFVGSEMKQYRKPAGWARYYPGRTEDRSIDRIRGRSVFSGAAECLLRVVAEVENRPIPKISRKVIFRELQRCEARHHVARQVRGRFSEERRGPLTSPRATRVSVPENCRSSPQTDFCNKIDPVKSRRDGTATAFPLSPR